MLPIVNSEEPYFAHLKYIDNPEFGGHLNMVPLTINQFVDIYEHIKSRNGFNRNVLRDLLDRIVRLRDSVDNGIDWEAMIPDVIQEWKESWEATVCV